jgi:hypothetical protein
MFKDYEKLIDDMLKSISDLKIDEQILFEIEKCFDNEVNEEEVYKAIGDVQVEDLGYWQTASIVKCMEKLMKHEDKELCGKYMRIIFYICKDSIFDRYHTASILGKSYKEIYSTLKEYGIPFYYYIVYKAKIMQDKNCLRSNYINQLKKLHTDYREDFILAYENTDNAPKILLGMVGVMKNDEFAEDLTKWLEKQCIIHNFKIYLENFKINEEQINIVLDYINGQDDRLYEALELLKNNFDKNSYDYYLSRFIIVIGYVTCEKIKISERILRLLILFYPQYTFSEIGGYIRSDYGSYIGNNSTRVLGDLHKKINILMDKINIPKENYIAFMAQEYVKKRAYYFKNCIKELFDQDKNIVKRAIFLCEGLENVFLASYFWEIGEGEEFKAIGEEEFLKNFKEVLYGEDIFSSNDIDNYIEYLKGNKELDEISIPKEIKNKYVDSYKYEDAFKLLIFIRKNSKVFDRAVNYVVELRNDYIFRRFLQIFSSYVSDKGEDLLELIESLKIETYRVLPLLTWVITKYRDTDNIEWLFQKLLKTETKVMLSSIALCDADGREYWIKKVSDQYKELNIDKEDYYEFLINFAGDSSKVVRECVFKYVQENKQCLDKMIPLLNNKKAQIRESAVKILGNNINDDYKKLLEDTLEKEKSSKVKNLIMEYLNIKEITEEKEDISIFEYCKKNLNKRKKAAVEWLKPIELPKLTLGNSKECIEEEVLYYLLISFAENKEIKLNLDAKKITSSMDQGALNDFAFEVLSKWIELGAEAKKKWVLSLAAMFGDNRVVDVLNNYIKKWAENSRGAIASEAVKALALQGSDEALLLVDSIGRKIKNKQVKRAAGEALKFAAQELGIDEDELGDRLVSNLGFNVEGGRIFDYGNRKFTVEINPELQLAVYKEDGKQLKNLPSVGKSDNKQMAEHAREEFKLLKKQLKTLVKVQGERLENALSVNRMWTSDKWKRLFVDNVIMQRFALGLIWGVYEENNLIQSFRYMEDGTFNTIDEEEYILPQDSEIGLVHPVELSEEDIEAWREQLEDYEIKQPFQQLSRKVFKMDEEEKEKREIERFGGLIINEYGMLNFEKLMWNKGEILDAGGYYEFYKENKKLGITAEIRHSGLCVGYFMGEDVTIYDLAFYKTEKYHCRGYGYNENNKGLYVKEIPKRFFSEIMYDVYKVTEKNIGKNENWKKEHR